MEDVYVSFTKLSQKDAKAQLDKYSDLYTNTTNTEGISDELFDTLVDYYEDTFGEIYDKIGAPPRGESKIVELPYSLFSLNKIKTGKKEDQKKLDVWLEKYRSDTYVIADKIDGVSGLYTVTHTKGKIVQKLYTRGDGKYGTDISALIEYLNLPVPKYDIAVRGEIILPDAPFQEYRRIAKANGTKNKLNLSRSTTIGIVNASSVKDSDSFDPSIASKLQFLAYRIVKWKYQDVNQETQYEELEKLGFDIPWFQTNDYVDMDLLEHFLELRRGTGEYRAPYLIDGLVVSQNVVAKHADDRNPSHMFAFKFDTIAEVTVQEVIWKAQKDGKLIPIVYYDKVRLSGADCIKATGHNAKRIFDWGIGPGATILISRANEVIPYIVSCVTPCEEFQLPDYPENSYGWNETEVDLVLIDPRDNPDVQIKRISYFFKHMNIKNIGPERASKLYESELYTVDDIITASRAQIVAAVGDAIGNKVYEELKEKINNPDLASLMTSSGIFGPGFGDRKLALIVEAIPEIMSYATKDEQEIATIIQNIGGFDKMAHIFANKLPEFVDWCRYLNIVFRKKSPVKTPKPKSGLSFAGQTIVFSGFRDAVLQKNIQELGGAVTSAVSGKTTMLIIKNRDAIKGKALEAQARGVEIITLDEFCAKYNYHESKFN
jgi:DNA ligase (NAD+)